MRKQVFWGDGRNRKDGNRRFWVFWCYVNRTGKGGGFWGWGAGKWTVVGELRRWIVGATSGVRGYGSGAKSRSHLSEWSVNLRCYVNRAGRDSGFFGG